MRGNKVYTDLGTIFDEIFEAAQDFHEEFSKNFNPYDAHFRPGGPFGDRGERGPFSFTQDENIDYYPNYSYPPMNVFMTADRTLVFEFALAGFDEKNIDLSFQGDYMIFSARIMVDQPVEENVRFFKRRLKLKDIDKQKYFVPADKFDQEKVKAVFRNGILRITVPPKEDTTVNEGIKIEIIKEGE
jgi:HSP20 family molecular chaperone IbpA